MARALWKGRIQFGDASLPVKLYHAEREQPSRLHVNKFVPADSIDPQGSNHTYALDPDGADGAFAVLYAALVRTKSAGLCQWSMRRRMFWGAIMARETLVLCVLRTAMENGKR